jgi:hypothetical protein
MSSVARLRSARRPGCIRCTRAYPLSSVTDILLRAAELPLTHRYIGVEQHARDYLDRVRVDGSFSPGRSAPRQTASLARVI